MKQALPTDNTDLFKQSKDAEKVKNFSLAIACLERLEESDNFLEVGFFMLMRLRLKTKDVGGIISMVRSVRIERFEGLNVGQIGFAKDVYKLLKKTSSREDVEAFIELWLSVRPGDWNAISAYLKHHKSLPASCSWTDISGALDAYFKPGASYKNETRIADICLHLSRIQASDQQEAEAHKIMQAVLTKITPVKKRGRKKVLH